MQVFVFVYMNLDLQSNMDVSVYINVYTSIYNLQVLHNYVHTHDTCKYAFEYASDGMYVWLPFLLLS